MRLEIFSLRTTTINSNQNCKYYSIVSLKFVVKMLRLFMSCCHQQATATASWTTMARFSNRTENLHL